MVLTRPEITKLLHVAADSYLLHLGYACHHELGVMPWGRRRADVLAVKLNGDIAVAEIKSSVPDFVSDGKWADYLPYCNRMWFVFTEDTYEKLQAKGETTKIREAGVGILVLSSASGWLESKAPSRRRHMEGRTKRIVVLRMAWRAAEVNKSKNIRKRVFLTEESKEEYAQEKAKPKSRRYRKGSSRRTRSKSRRRVRAS